MTTTTNDKLKDFIAGVGLPRMIIFGFFVLLCVSSVPLGLDLSDLISNVLIRIGMNGVLVLAMVPAVQCGISLNFGISLGIVGGLLGSLISIEMGFSGVPSFIAAVIIGVVISSVIGFGYGNFLNKVKGSEMTVSTYVGFSMISLMNIAWLILPFKNRKLGWVIGQGLRNTIDISDSFGKLLVNFLSFKIGKVVVPTGALLFFLLCCLLVYMFLQSKLGMAMSAAGINPQYARAAGINVERMRVIGTTISTALAGVGIITYAQSYGFLQLYNGPLLMSFAAVAAVLIGGASVKRATISNVIIGTFLFQGIISIGLPVANKIIPEGNLSEVMRLIISNGIILYSLTKANGGDGR